MSRLIAYELRKLFDTRSSIVTMLVCIVAAVGLGALGLLVQEGGVLDLSQTAAAAVLPFAIIAPVLSAIAAASDWRTQAIQQTLFVESRRDRIFRAKIAASLIGVLGISGVAIVLAVAAGLTVGLSREQPMVLGGFWAMVWGVVALVVPGCLFGFAIGAVALSPPVAVAVVLFVELVFDLALAVVPDGGGRYFASASFPNWMASGADPLAAVTSAALWIVVPGAVGFLRYLRKESS
ncbi:hypothetical protein EDF46_0849 [Frondihabitans sp. PhB188]|uniref:hypothetical protein n=1 Tax=Frondihabitans sp. PhB188 TaxID=2485200 RepID=UPI000F482207|nr:hypothetical protein [Frondihabitans sp. PhB188]ROQ41470.1 hypothetical protein EDF46_0849 [Frondihabitans sp. PhB188]